VPPGPGDLALEEIARADIGAALHHEYAHAARHLDECDR
jgi:hypothetical protein